MSVRGSRLSGASTAVALGAAALVIAACGSSGGGNQGAGSSGGSGAASVPASSQHSASHVKLRTASGPAGTYLTDASGRALYLWVADGKGSSSCMGQCAKYWPPLMAKGKPAASGSVKAADLGTIKRSGGGRQVTYKGHPLYYYVGDKGPGSTSGQGSNNFGAKWWLVGPSGAALTKSSSGGSSSGSSGGGSSSSGGGWS